MLRTLGTSLLGIRLTGNGVLKAGYGNKEGKGMLRAVHGNKMEFEIRKYYRNEPSLIEFIPEIICLKQ